MSTSRRTASFHLFRVPRRMVGAALARMALDRGPLARTPGLRFSKLLGTGDGRTFTIRDADPTRWGLFAVWESPADLARFEQTSAVAAAWDRIAVEIWRAELVPLRSRGTWSGREPFGAIDDASAHGPAVAVTRARLRWRTAPSFWRAVPPVAAELQRAAGLRFSVGFGEAPLGVQGTFSVWESPAALRSFAYGGARHRDAIRATAEVGWYREELFARLAVRGTTGTIDGCDPLEGLLPGPAGAVDA